MSAPFCWVSETLSTDTVTDATVPGWECVVEAVGEVPQDRDGNRLPTLGNRYYPSMVRVGTKLLLAGDAMALGKAITAAAAVCLIADAKDTGPCGHWAPCDEEGCNRD